MRFKAGWLQLQLVARGLSNSEAARRAEVTRFTLRKALKGEDLSRPAANKIVKMLEANPPTISDTEGLEE